MATASLRPIKKQDMYLNLPVISALRGVSLRIVDRVVFSDLFVPIRSILDVRVSLDVPRPLDHRLPDSTCCIIQSKRCYDNAYCVVCYAVLIVIIMVKSEIV